MTDLSRKNRIVIKVGTSNITYKTGNLNIRRVEHFIRVLADLKNSGREIILVTSGAIGIGVGKLGLSRRPEDMPAKQACAAVGQCELMNIYGKEFLKYNHIVSQILITRDVVSNNERKQNVVNTLETLIKFKVVPIINANDSISLEALDFDENDTLSAIIAKLCKADLLVILSDVDGLYDKNPAEPGAKFLPLVNKITSAMIANASEKGSELSSGGMLTKLEAAGLALEDDIETVIMSGENPEALYALFENKAKCTVFTNRGELI